MFVFIRSDLLRTFYYLVNLERIIILSSNGQTNQHTFLDRSSYMLDAFFKGLKVPAKLFWEPSSWQYVKTVKRTTELNVQQWTEYSSHRWTFWFLLFWSIAPIFIWWKCIDRRRFLEISFFGLFTSLCAGILDSLGVQMSLWFYPDSLVPFLPNFFPIDYVVIPVMFMLIYQRFGSWKSFIIVTTVLSTVLSLLIDPFIVWANIYQPLSWHYIYSIPVFVFMVSFAKLITIIVTKQDSTYNCNAKDSQ